MAKKARSTKAGGKGTKTSKSSHSSGLKKPSAAKKAVVSQKDKAMENKVWLKKSPMSKAELKEFRQLLLDKRRALIGDMTGMANEALRTNRQEGSGDLSKIPTHDADVGTDNYEQEFTLGLLESERTLLGEINEALERIDNNTFGICLGTGQAISKERLKARPWAKYCIEYARLLEKGLVSQPSAQDDSDSDAEDEDSDADDIDDVEEEEPEVEDSSDAEKVPEE